MTTLTQALADALERLLNAGTAYLRAYAKLVDPGAAGKTVTFLVPPELTEATKESLAATEEARAALATHRAAQQSQANADSFGVGSTPDDASHSALRSETGLDNPAHSTQASESAEALPPAYMLAKLQMVMPVMQEARDALTALSVAQCKLYGIALDLADRMDRAGTFSLADWAADPCAA